MFHIYFKDFAPNRKIMDKVEIETKNRVDKFSFLGRTRYMIYCKIIHYI